MSRVYLAVHVELETEDCDPETVKACELAAARLEEHLEAKWAETFEEVKKKFPGLKIDIGESSEGEEWKA
jgi:hypothetical protein